MQFGEWKNRSRAYKRAIVEAEYPLDEKRIESLCRAAFVAGVDWGLETHDAKVGAGKTARQPSRYDPTWLRK